MSRQRGFTLTFVIVALIMVGVAMFVLTGGSNVMLFHADTAYLQAVERNLIASGLAWAQAGGSGGRRRPVGEPVELDVTSLNGPGARLVVQVLDVRDGRATVRIETSCSKGRRTLDTSRNYTVSIP
jgi:type II secretory pathway pseudopilin PulG